MCFLGTPNLFKDMCSSQIFECYVQQKKKKKNPTFKKKKNIFFF